MLIDEYLSIVSADDHLQGDLLTATDLMAERQRSVARSFASMHMEGRFTAHDDVC